MILMKTTHPLFFLRAIIWDFEDTSLVEVESTVFTLQALLEHPKQHLAAKAAKEINSYLFSSSCNCNSKKKCHKKGIFEEMV